jgi:hypothetical protein
MGNIVNTHLKVIFLARDIWNYVPMFVINKYITTIFSLSILGRLPTQYSIIYKHSSARGNYSQLVMGSRSEKCVLWWFCYCGTSECSYTSKNSYNVTRQYNLMETTAIYVVLRWLCYHYSAHEYSYNSGPS